MGGSTQQTTSTSSTAPSNPQVTATLNQILGGVQDAYKAGPTYVAPGSTTTGSQSAALTAANNPNFLAGINGALGQTAGLIGNGGLTTGQQGNLGQAQSLADQYAQMASDPGKSAAGQNLINDVTTATNAAFNNDGLFGSDNNQTALARGLAQGLGALQQNYMSGEGSALSNAFGMGQQGTSNLATLGGQLLPALYQTNQMPSGTAAAIGSAQDTAAQAAANKNLSLLGNLTSILSGNAATAGNTTTQVNTTPTQNPLLGLLGLGIQAL